jgi:hypothetical protein
MQLPKNLLLLVILFVTSQIYFAQETPKAELIDEFGRLTCEDIIARQDALLNILNEEPTSTGYIIIYSNKKDSRAAWRMKMFIDGQTELRRFDQKRLTVFRGTDESEVNVQFWKVPAGAEKPEFKEIGWNYDLSNRKKLFKFNSSEWDVSPCPIGSQFDSYSNYLKANKNFRGHIVIFTKSNKEFQKVKENLLNKLPNDYKVSPNQLRFFFVKQKIDYTNYEFWLVP